jgi:hypothetical protein
LPRGKQNFQELQFELQTFAIKFPFSLKAKTLYLDGIRSHDPIDPRAETVPQGRSRRQQDDDFSVPLAVQNLNFYLLIVPNFFIVKGTTLYPVRTKSHDP